MSVIYFAPAFFAIRASSRASKSSAVNVSIHFNEFTVEKKDELIGIAKNKKNAAAVGIAGRILLVNALPMDVIFSSPAIESVEYVFMFDFGFVWMFVVMILLARIFEYGQKLQQESDETL